ncbi:MAG: TrkA C-terminal domain-containing protein, partial [Eubacteriales bacterium]|nr:TrkA C-terminal domain-containing protein [Eubacteriales bacterium]
QGAKKVIVKVNNDNFVPLINGSSLETIISPKRIVANRILSYARAVSAGTVSGNIKSMYKFIDGNVEMLEFSAGADGSYLNVPLKDLAIQKGIIVACIIREGKVIIPGGNEKILANDSVLLVTAERQLQSLSDMVASR